MTNGVLATDIDANFLAEQMEDPALWLVDIRPDEEKITGVLDVAFLSDIDPSSLWLPSSVKYLVLIASIPVSEITLTVWQGFADQYQIKLSWLTGLPEEWQKAGFTLVIPPLRDTNPTTQLPRIFLIPRGICELADPAMVIDRETLIQKQ